MDERGGRNVLIKNVGEDGFLGARPELTAKPVRPTTTSDDNRDDVYEEDDGEEGLRKEGEDEEGLRKAGADANKINDKN